MGHSGSPFARSSLEIEIPGLVHSRGGSLELRAEEVEGLAAEEGEAGGFLSAAWQHFYKPLELEAGEATKVPPPLLLLLLLLLPAPRSGVTEPCNIDKSLGGSRIQATSTNLSGVKEPSSSEPSPVPPTAFPCTHAPRRRFCRSLCSC